MASAASEVVFVLVVVNVAGGLALVLDSKYLLLLPLMLLFLLLY